MDESLSWEERYQQLDAHYTVSTNRAALLSEHLADTLKAAGVIGKDMHPNGPELLMAAQDYIAHRIDPLATIDESLDSILKRPGMHGAERILTLETLVCHLLGLREIWAPQPSGGRRGGWGPVYNVWVKEYFGSSNSLSAAGRLSRKFEWAPDATMHDHPETWPKILAFYAEWVRREREVADKGSEAAI